MKTSDEALASQAAAGNAAAFRELLDRHYDRVFRVFTVSYVTKAMLRTLLRKYGRPYPKNYELGAGMPN
jgi:hypothetical protein